MHEPDYRASLEDWNSFAEALTSKLTEIDELIPELPIKDIVGHLQNLKHRHACFVAREIEPHACLLIFHVSLTCSHWQTFRIYRDIRFSKDKTPYKVPLQA